LTNSELHNDINHNTEIAEQNSTKSLVSMNMGPVKVLPVEGDLFNRAFTPEEHFMINLCNICNEANAPLDLVDKVVAVIHDAHNNGLNMESNVVRSREYFLKHLNKRFNVPIPETFNVAIEDLSGNDHTINVICHIFLSQAMDSIHDHKIWGNEFFYWNC